LARFLADKEHNQIPAGARLTHCRINVFSSPVPFLNKSKMRRTSQNVSHFILRHMMFAIDFLNDLFEPDDTRKLQSRVLASEGVFFLSRFESDAMVDRIQRQ
jgi:hypothetical protein